MSNPYYSTVVFSDEEAIRAILDLHCKGNIDVDVTYSKGNFYKSSIPQPTHKFDLYPQTEDTICANAESVPLPDSSVDTIMFDPPFLATTGKSLSVDNGSNKINKRFGVFPNEKALHTFYVNAMKEQYRLLKDDGILIFKCQDKVSSGKQYMSHVFIMKEAEKIGFYVKDFLILIAKQRIVADWQKKSQKHCRNYHSYYTVLKKCSTKVEYV
jgi:tRNA G10  N-methylase Trm11